MDSTTNIDGNLTNFKSLVNERISTFDSILKSLETASHKSKAYLVKILNKDGRIDNSLLETYQFESHAFAWFKLIELVLEKHLTGTIDLMNLVRLQI